MVAHVACPPRFSAASSRLAISIAASRKRTL
nr:MAG TPA: hypothetical protein [Caudoviricetes sp.]